MSTVMAQTSSRPAMTVPTAIPATEDPGVTVVLVVGSLSVARVVETDVPAWSTLN